MKGSRHTIWARIQQRGRTSIAFREPLKDGLLELIERSDTDVSRNVRVIFENTHSTRLSHEPCLGV